MSPIYIDIEYILQTQSRAFHLDSRHRSTPDTILVPFLNRIILYPQKDYNKRRVHFGHDARTGPGAFLLLVSYISLFAVRVFRILYFRND